ncbi:hypothetical protein [Anaerobacillus sp. 1_MG-2023]|uniref:hypothetical protein n=1 Tax=Anaerobacillus sp. 1_MG-2023 TaxID=3062655 RepID=UPI0026E1DDFD|nr:hypothetical protein [Anaerobacillus sp. 1_MG-2023]MDO6654361.1 hypothetical protein [Anaerobacillus sp. 1_MG-2023]
MKIKSLSILLGILLLIGLAGCGENEAQTVNTSKVDVGEETAAPATSEDDFSQEARMIANDEKLIEMLKSTGVIKEGATPAEIQNALEEYLKEKAEGIDQGSKSSEKYIEDLKKQIQQDLEEDL